MSDYAVEDDEMERFVIISDDENEAESTSDRTYQHITPKTFNVELDEFFTEPHAKVGNISVLTGKPNLSSDNTPVKHPQRARKLGRPSSRKPGGPFISMDQMKAHMDNVARFWNRKQGVARCPVCPKTIAADNAHKIVLHLATHLDNEQHFPFRCPVADCDKRSLQLFLIKMHVKSAHHRNWSANLKKLSTDDDNKQLFMELSRLTH